MKKILHFFVLTVLFAYVASFATASVVIAGDSAKYNPNNIKIVKLGTCNSGPLDTFASTGGAAKVYGPYSMSIDGSRPAFGGFKLIHHPAAWTAGGTMTFVYQVLSSSNIGDTVSLAWKAIGSAGAALTDTLPYISLAAYPGKSIVFKLANTASQIVILNYPIRVVLYETSTSTVDTKH